MGITCVLHKSKAIKLGGGGGEGNNKDKQHFMRLTGFPNRKCDPKMDSVKVKCSNNFRPNDRNFYPDLYSTA